MSEDLIKRILSKKAVSLFSGALISVAGSLAIQNEANAAELTLAAAEEWKDGADAGTDVTHGASASDNVNLVTFTLTIDDTGDSTAVGDITGSTGEIIITSDTVNTDVSSTINSINLTGAGNIDINSLEADNSMMTVTITDQLTTGGYLKVTSTEDDAADDIILDLDGNVAVTADSTFTADAGAGAGGNVTVNMAGATVTFTAGFNMDDSTGVVQINVDGTTDQTITGVIDGAAANEGMINVSQTSGTVTFASNIGATQPLLEIEIDASATVVLSGLTKIKDLDLDGTVWASTAANILGNGLNWATGSKVVVDDSIVAGTDVFNVLANATVVAGAMTIEVPANFTSGTITLLDTAHDITADVANMTVTDTALYNYSVSNVEGDASASDAHLTVVAYSTNDVKSNVGLDHLNEAKALKEAALAFRSETATTLDNTTKYLNASKSNASIKELAQEGGTQADIIRGQMQAASVANNNTLSINSQRLASLRDGTNFPTGATGFNAGAGASSQSAFAKAFVSTSSQDSSGGIKGFDSDLTGFTIGFDGIADNGVRTGISYTIADSDIDGKGAGQAKTDVKSHIVALYSDYSTDTYYVETQLAVGRNEYTAERKINVSNLSIDRTAKGLFDGLQGSLTLAAGVPLPQEKGIWVTPRGSLTLLKTMTGSYTETGATNLNQKYDRATNKKALAGFGLNIDKVNETDASTVNTQLRIGLSYDLIDDPIEAAANFASTGGKYTSVVNQEPLSANIGLGLAAVFGTFELGLDADSQFKDDYESYTGLISARYKF